MFYYNILSGWKLNWNHQPRDSPSVVRPHAAVEPHRYLAKICLRPFEPFVQMLCVSCIYNEPNHGSNK